MNRIFDVRRRAPIACGRDGRRGPAKRKVTRDTQLARAQTIETLPTDQTTPDDGKMGPCFMLVGQTTIPSLTVRGAASNFPKSDARWRDRYRRGGAQFQRTLDARAFSLA